MNYLYRSMNACLACLILPMLHAASTLPVPSTGTYLGVWVGHSSTETEETAIELLEGPSGVNRTFAFHLAYYGWTDLRQLLNSAGVFQPDTTLQGDIDHGRVPVISWTCDRLTTNSDHIIASGDPTEDAVITAAAKALAQYPGPVLLRWFWEFNLLSANDGNQPCRNDNGTATQQVYTDFIGAWQHIHQLFQSAGAANVIFLWNPGHYTDGGPDDPHSFYPGNAYVDWIGVDTYQRSQTANFVSDFGVFYTDFTASQYGGKPLMVGENASANESVYNTELQPTYLNGILADVQSNLYPALKAYCYFDAAGNAPNDWVLDAQGLPAFATLAASPSFLATPPAFFNGQVSLGSGAYYLQFPNGTVFGYYSTPAFPIFYHFDMGFEAFIDGGNGAGYLYDFASSHWFYTSPSLFPYLYDFTLNAWLYYFPNTKEPGHYTTDPRYFSNLTTGKTFSM